MMMIACLVVLTAVTIWHMQQYTTSANKITITSNSAQFLPLTKATDNQLKVIVHYQTNDVFISKY